MSTSRYIERDQHLARVDVQDQDRESTYEIEIETRNIKENLLENHRTCTSPRDDKGVNDETVNECEQIL